MKTTEVKNKMGLFSKKPIVQQPQQPIKPIVPGKSYGLTSVQESNRQEITKDFDDEIAVEQPETQEMPRDEEEAQEKSLRMPQKQAETPLESEETEEQAIDTPQNELITFIRDLELRVMHLESVLFRRM